MDWQHILIPIALFACVTYAFKAVLDAVMRYRMLREPGTEELLRTIVQAEEEQRRLASLRWGLILVALAGGFALIQTVDWREINAGAVAVLAFCTGAGHLVFYAMSRRKP
jgi:hypothetical protein